MHPDIETLVSCLYDELRPGQQRPLKRHLAKCRICRGNYERLKESLLAPPASPADGSGLLDKLRAWDSAQLARRAAEHLRNRVAGELAPYLGRAGADLLMEHNRGDDLLSHVTPFLTLFLGRKAARCLVTRVVEKAIVGEGTV